MTSSLKEGLALQFLVDRVAFRNALQRVEMAIDRKPTRPVLGGVLIVAEEDGLLLLASDLEIAVRYKLTDVQVNSQGWAVLPGRELVEVIKDVESETVSVELENGNRCKIQAGEDVCELVTMESSLDSGEDQSSLFPSIPPLEGTATVTLDKDVFLSMVGATRFATSRVHDSRFATEGVLFEVREGEVTLVGTDGRRLACIRRPALGFDDPKKGERSRSVLLPKVLDQITRFGQDEDVDSLDVFFLGNQVGFRVGNLESFGRVLEGEFPNYDNVIPKSSKHVVRAHRESMQKKLRLASHLTQDAAAVVRLQISPDTMEVSAEHEGRGRASATLEVDYSGSGLTAQFNPNFLLDGLKAAHEDQVEIHMDEASRPAKFILGEDFAYVVMPLTHFP